MLIVTFFYIWCDACYLYFRSFDKQEKSNFDEFKGNLAPATIWFSCLFLLHFNPLWPFFTIFFCLFLFLLRFNPSVPNDAIWRSKNAKKWVLLKVLYLLSLQWLNNLKCKATNLQKPQKVLCLFRIKLVNKWVFAWPNLSLFLSNKVFFGHVKKTPLPLGVIRLT